VLLVVGSVAVAELIGVALLLTGARPADPLHFLYGAAALIVLPVAISFGARTSSVDASRIRRDAWTVVGGIVLLGILFRLYATG
jgi:hypothetical protein